MVTTRNGFYYRRQYSREDDDNNNKSKTTEPSSPAPTRRSSQFKLKLLQQRTTMKANSITKMSIVISILLLQLVCVQGFTTSTISSINFNADTSSIRTAGRSIIGGRNTKGSSTVILPMSNTNENDDTDDNDNDNNNNMDNNKNDEVEKMQQKANELREQIRKMEESLPKDRMRNYDIIPPKQNNDNDDDDKTFSFRNKRIMVVGANGRVGSMVCKYLLRTYGNEIKELVAAVHTVSENSRTSRGYGRLSYEVGAEDGRGSIGPAWSGDDERVASFEYTNEMKDYYLNKLRLVEVELLDPIQCQTITEGIDSIIWCATDFNGNKPRSVSSLDVAFLFRAVADPTKGRVEIEGLQNILGGLIKSKQDSRRTNQLTTNSSSGGGSGSGGSGGNNSNLIEFVLISPSPEALPDYETPFGNFIGQKRQGEAILMNDFPSINSVVLQMNRYDDNFVDENLDITYLEPEKDVIESDDEEVILYEKGRRRINRRDAARAAVESVINESFVGKIIQVWTATRGASAIKKKSSSDSSSSALS